MKQLFFIISIFLSFTITAQEEMHIVLLAGQSNMAGRGISSELSTVVKERINKVSDRVLLSTSDSSNEQAKPLSAFTKQFGPELMVGLTLAEANPNQHYLLIKKAVGGTSLYGAWSSEWSQGKANISERGEVRRGLKLFDLHVKNIHRNLNKLKRENKNYKILGLLWFQGESDTNKEITATNYQINIQKLINGYRKEFGKNMLFIIGQINVLPRKYKIGPSQVRNAMSNFANADDNVELVKTSMDDRWLDYPKHKDNLHYNTEGQIRLGVAFANKLIGLKKY